ncbi:MAG: neutral/alkaline non-lysosomal ceramidase N-terminal domain-containing protein [Planctomycetota bacterium]
MQFGFARVDITPRVGVELQGYGPFLNRHSDGVRDPLFARAMALEANGTRAVVVSCDLIGVSAAITAAVRANVTAATGLPGECLLLHATHTHSGPSLPIYTGWGTPDPPYLELLHRWLARAAIEALARLAEGTLRHAEVSCRGIAINREYDAFRAASVEAAMADDWQPARPDLTDTTCHVFAVDCGGRMTGFFSYYSCHPVVCGHNCRKIHGDYPGVATNLVERLHPGAVGMFLQGALGDINAAVVCPEESEGLRALDVLAVRYARVVLNGLQTATELPAEEIRCATRPIVFSRKPWGLDAIQAMLHEQETILHAPEARDTEREVRMAVVRATALRALRANLLADCSTTTPSQLHGLRFGRVALLGTPLEVFRAIKNEALSQTRSALPLVLGFVDDSLGYAIDRSTAAKGGYAVDLVPLMCNQAPFANIHDELVAGLVALDADLNA